MSLNDLRDQLHHQAAEIDLTEPVPLTAVRRRATRLRRRRLATTTAGTAILAVVAVVAVSNGFRTDADAPAPASTPSAPSDGLPGRAPQTSADDHVQNGIRYRAAVAGDVLQAAQVGKVGQGAISLRWTPGKEQVDVRVFCSYPGGGQSRVVLRVDGRAITTEACSFFPITDPGSIVTARLAAKDLFPDPNRAADITAEIVDSSGRPSQAPNQQVGFGIYTRNDRPDSPGQLIDWPEEIEHQGHLYRRAGNGMTTTFSPTTTNQGVAVETPAFKPFIAVFGSFGVPTTHTFEIAGVSGGQTFRTTPNDGPLAGLKSVAVEPQAAGQIEIRALTPIPTEGLLTINLYLPAD